MHLHQLGSRGSDDLDVDPIALVRNRRGPAGGDFSLSQYVNDRPYAVSSFMSVALAKLFGTAMAGRSKERPDLADASIPLEVGLPVTPCRGGEAVLRRLFEPLGYEVTAEPLTLDANFPEWGDSRYMAVCLRTTARLRDVLEQLFVLLPVLDDDKHYWVGSDEVDKLLRRGGAWLTAHPERELIARRYLRHDRHLTRDALARLADEGEDDPDRSREERDAEEEQIEQPLRLNDERVTAVVGVIRASVVYGHTPVPEAVWLNRTICIDTGCVFGGRLTALRYPERELVSVAAKTTYYEPARPLSGDALGTGQGVRSELELDIDDVIGKRLIETSITGSRVTIRQENAAAALETMSRFAIDPRWLVYLPPTMAPTATSEREGLLEHPHEAFAAYRTAGVDEVVCEEKHMGSRAVVVACRDESVAGRRFGIDGNSTGVIYTRTGRPFFSDRELEAEMLRRVRTAIDAVGLWDELATDWLLFDCELLPWSAKAEELLRRQYASVGAAATAALEAEVAALDQAVKRGADVDELLDRALALREFALGIEALERFVGREPLYRVHECAFGVLALESEPVDPRL